MIIVKPDNNGIKKAVKVLKLGGTVVYPTDTAYAMGGIFNSKKVQDKILKIKKRKDKKFTLIASSFSQVNKFFSLNTEQKKLVQKFWPAPLSLVVSNRFAVRVPKNKIAQSLARGAGRPIIATSANLSGEKTLYDSKKIIEQFTAKGGSYAGGRQSAYGGKNKENPCHDSNSDKSKMKTELKREPDLIIDFGQLKKIETSTIVAVTKNGIEVLRKGSVAISKE